TADDPGYEVVPETEEVAPPNAASKKVTTPQAAKERRDAGIRKMLGVAEDAEQFDFGPYRILGEVASGGMGIIYRAVESATGDRKSTRLNSSHVKISYAVFCLKKKRSAPWKTPSPPLSSTVRCPGNSLVGPP